MVRSGNHFETSGAEPGDVARSGVHHLLHAGDGVDRRIGRARDDHGGRIWRADDIDPRQVVAADRQRDQVGAAITNVGRLDQLVCESVAGIERAKCIGVVGAGAADRIVHHPRQAVDRLQRLHEGGAAGEGAVRRVDAGNAAEMERAAGSRASVGIAVAEAIDRGELSPGGREHRTQRDHRGYGGAEDGAKPENAGTHGDSLLLTRSLRGRSVTSPRMCGRTRERVHPTAPGGQRRRQPE